uniref:Uracil-DNA glycosylase n=1 Tax=Strongyloides papillosus TaxID=174720 RepID=A0A0N5C5Z7_STREA
MFSSIFSGISSLFRRTKKVEELANEVANDNSTIVSETEEKESSFVNQRKRKFDFSNDEFECSDIRKNIKSMLNCTSIGGKKKENYEHLKNASFFNETQCNNLVTESKRFKSSKKKETYLRAYTDDYSVSADRKIIDAFEILHDGIVEACEKFPHAKLLVLGDNPVYQNFLKKREEDENFLDSIESYRIRKLVTKIVMLEFKHDITFDETGSTFAQGVLEISAKGEATVECFNKYNNFLTSYEYYKRYMDDRIL